MPYYFNLDGVGEIKCDTIDELRAAAGQNAGQIRDVSADPPRNPGVGRPRKRVPLNPEAKSPGIGPKKSWAIADWYAGEHNLSRNDARTALAKLKKEEPKKFLGIIEKYEASAKK